MDTENKMDGMTGDRFGKFEKNKHGQKLYRCAAKTCHIQELYGMTPKPIKDLAHALKSGPAALKLTDGCALLFAYALASIMASKRIQVTNSFQRGEEEASYTNLFVMLLGTSGDQKSSFIATANAILKQVNELAKDDWMVKLAA